MQERTKILNKHMAKAIIAILDAYINAFSLPLDKTLFRKLFKRWGIEVESSIDEGLEKIDSAKKSLSDALEAIEDIKETAENNKRDAEAALERLKTLEESKASAEAELSEIRKLASSDINAFRKLGGIPGPDDIRRERYIGFVSGIVASIVASIIIWTLGFLL